MVVVDNQTSRRLSIDQLLQSNHENEWSEFSDLLSHHGDIDLCECYVTYALKCFNPDDFSQQGHLSSCAPYLAYEIAKLLPKLRILIVCGDIAAKQIFGEEVRADIEPQAGVTPEGVRFLLLPHLRVIYKQSEVESFNAAIQEFFSANHSG